MKPVYSGKVREIYQISEDRLAIVTTDRMSAFDHILPVPVKGKGVVLNQLSNFWFRQTKDIVPNHIIEEDADKLPAFFQSEDFRGRTVLTEKLDMLPFEFVVRGYMLGSMWKAYEKGKDFCGYRLPAGYLLAQKLEEPILTPAVKHDTGHDEYCDMQTVAAELGPELAEKIAEICLELYRVCSGYALERGVIIADAKFEFGLNKQGELTLGDEIFTPDASRFWDAAEYRVGVSPKSYDKQFLRDWLESHKENGEYRFDTVPREILKKTEEIYQECLRRLVGAASRPA